MLSGTKVTLEDIARRAGVSTAAVSQALSGKGTLAQSTRERILLVVEELSYQPDRAAQNLAQRRTSQISAKSMEGRPRMHVPPPGVTAFYSIHELLEVVHLEIQQMEEEGRDVAAFLQQVRDWKRPTKQKCYQLYARLMSAPMRADWRYEEPDSLAEIERLRSGKRYDAQLTLTSAVIFEKIYGGWLGRVVGSVLGKPLQAGWSRRQVTAYLQMANSYPLRGYVPRLVPPPTGFELRPEAAGNFLGEIHHAPFDDDTDFTILALHILETYSLGFKTSDVATEWLSHLPYFGTFTTDRAVYRNLIWNINPEEAACFANPEREFIGGRTRADLYGFVAPGRPDLAAALAYRDAALSHSKNGVYSAMMMAAMLAWAFCTDNVDEIVQAGLSVIPANCRLAEAVRDVLAARASGSDWELAYEQLLLKYGGYSPIHTINNMAWVILALLFSGGDLDLALGIAVTCGMDTGSNAASVGSLLGLALGSTHIPAHWTNPLNDTLGSGLAHFSQMQISDLARRTARIVESILSQRS